MILQQLDLFLNTQKIVDPTLMWLDFTITVQETLDLTIKFSRSYYI